jgi:hypothetical protein
VYRYTEKEEKENKGGQVVLKNIQKKVVKPQKHHSLL